MVSATDGGSLPTLRPDDFVLFMKRLRKSRGPGVRFLQAGEYGSLGRPHHHAVLFNCDFPDMRFFRTTPSGATLFVSEELGELWPHGFVSVGSVTFESAAYVARYTLKKVGGDLAAVHYRGRHPEYLTMSRRPGIGSGWYQKFWRDMFPADRLVIRNGQLSKPPRFYEERFKAANPHAHLVLKGDRERAVNVDEQDGSRLYAKAEVKRSKVRLLKRGL